MHCDALKTRQAIDKLEETFGVRAASPNVQVNASMLNMM